MGPIGPIRPIGPMSTYLEPPSTTAPRKGTFIVFSRSCAAWTAGSWLVPQRTASTTASTDRLSSSVSATGKSGAESTMMNS